MLRAEEHGKSELWRKTKTSGVRRLIACVVVSVVLFTLSCQGGSSGPLEAVRGFFQTATMPIRYFGLAVTAPVRGLGNIFSNLTADQAAVRAQSLLDSWKSGSADEESFAVMAVENTADTGSQSTGGLYTGVSPYSGYVEDFTNWCLDSSRQPGDTGLVKNTGSSTQGWHIMYFVGWNDPAWKFTAKNALASAATQEWAAGLYADVEAQQGSGIQYVK